MATCLGITQGAVYDCTNPLVPFVRQRLLIGNLEDIATITFSLVAGEENVITAITMSSGKAMFAFDGVKASITAQAELVATAFAPQYNHQNTLIVWEVDNTQKLNLQGMAAVPQFSIVENSKDSSLGNSVFEVFGVGRGMEVSELIRINADADTSGGYSVTLVTPDEGGKETALPDSFFDTSLTVTEAAVEALLTPAL